MASLSPEQVLQFRESGYLAPLRVLSRSEVAGARANLHALMEKTAGMTDAAARHKPHLYSKWISDLIRDPRVLGPVADLLGPDLLVWKSVFFVKQAHTPQFVDWHQDSAYWGFESEDVVTAWIALTESTIENGCLRVVPGSHRRPEVPHAIRFAENNLLVRGQGAAVEIPDDETRCVELSPGEMSVHHVRMLHGSGANGSAGPRVGLAVRYIATSVRHRGRRPSATLVSGEDRFGNFALEPEPRFDDDPLALAWHRRSRRRYAGELMWDTIVRQFPGNVTGLARLVAHPRRVGRSLRAAWRSR